MPPYTPYDAYDQWYDQNNSESEMNRRISKESDEPVQCQYCSNHFYDRCWDHSTDEEKDLVKKCETIAEHNCTHNFKCGGCHTQYLLQENLDDHSCAKKYQCDICLKRFQNIQNVNSGNHRFRRKKKVVNCNDFSVRVSKTGRRMLHNKPSKDTAREEEEQKGKKKAKDRSKEVKKMVKNGNIKTWLVQKNS